MESGGNNPQGGGIPRHATGSLSTKAAKNQQFIATHNLQHLIHSQVAGGNGPPSSTKSQATLNAQKAYSSKMVYEGSITSNMSTPTIGTTQYQRAYTQLYQQTPLTGGGKSAKNLASCSSSQHHNKSSKAYNAGGSQHKKETSLKQVDLQAKFANLLKLSKDAVKEKAMQSQTVSSKTDKKGEKRDQAANARNQLFGETGQRVQRESGGGKTGVRESGRPPQASQGSPPRAGAALRQTPLTQQMLIIQNTNSPACTRPPSQNMALKTFQGPIVSMMDPKSQTQGFPRQASMSIPSNAMVDNFIMHSSKAGEVGQHPACRQSQQFTSAPRSSNSRTRDKKTRVTAASQRQATNQVSSHATEPARTYGGASETGKVNRASQITTSSKSKKKKQQPSQQQVAIDPVEEYLANATRLQQQMQTLNALPNAANNTPIQQIDQTPQPASEVTPHTHTNMRENIEQNFSAAMSSIHSQSAQPPATSQAQISTTSPRIEALESQLLASFKTKCQQEMQTQMKQAVAKLLYTKREVMMEIKAFQSTVRTQQPQPITVEKSPPKEQEAPPMDEQKVYDIINGQLSTLEQSYKIAQDKSNQLFDERIDDVLMQIQSILSGLEDTFYAKTGQLESEVLQLEENAEKLRAVTDTKIESTIQISKHALEQHKQTQSTMARFVQHDHLEQELESLRKHLQESPIKMPEFFQKNSDEIPFMQTQLQECDEKISQIEESMVKQIRAQAKHQERLTDTQDKVKRALEDTKVKFEQLLQSSKTEMQEVVKKEIAQREATLETKLEKNKQQFLKAVNGNMRILDNLISDYTTRTHDQIKQQLRSGSQSRGHTSNRPLSHNDIEEMPSVKGSICSQQNPTVKQHYQRTLEALTAQSQKMPPGSLSSVQDVSESNKQELVDEELSSALLSTARDRQIQAEVAAENSSAKKQIRKNQQGVPELQFQNISQKGQIGANSERLNLASCFSAMGVQERGLAPEAHHHLNRSGSNEHDYGTPARGVLLQHHDTVPDIKKLHANERNSNNIIIVEEQKFIESRPGSSINEQKQFHPRQDQPQIESQNVDESPPGSKTRSPQKSRRIAAIQDPNPDEEEKEVHYRVNQQQQQQYRQQEQMEGDMQERSMEMLVPQMDRDNLPSPQIRSSFTEIKQKQQDKLQLEYNNRLRNGGTAFGITPITDDGYKNIEEEPSKFDDEGEEPIDFALSVTSPYLIHSGGAPQGQQSSIDGGSVDGMMAYNFGYNSMQNVHSGLRSQSLRQHPGKGIDQGAISTRMTKNVSQLGPSAVAYTVNASTFKQETTDSDFFNLTEENDSQMDPILVMRNLSNTQLCSATTSMIQIQENQDTNKQSFHNFLNERPQSKTAQMTNECQNKAYKILEIEQIPSHDSQDPSHIQISSNAHGSSNAHASNIMVYEPVVVQTISNRLNSMTNIKEYTPDPKHELQQQSFDNLNDGGNLDDRSQSRAAVIPKPIMIYEQVKTPSVMQLTSASALSLRSPEMEIQGGTAPDKDDGSELIESIGRSQQNPMLTKEQARRSSMVFMEEKQPKRQPATMNSLLEPTLPKMSAVATTPQQMQQESSSYSSTGNKTDMEVQKYTRGKKPGSDLPPNLQRHGNEIIHQLLLDEVIAALEEVIQMSGDKLNDIILDQQNAITISNRDLIRQSRTTKRRVITRDEDGVMLDNSDRYELSDADSLTIQIDQSQEQPAAEDSLEENPSVPAQASQGGQELDDTGRPNQDDDDFDGEQEMGEQRQINDYDDE